MQIYEVTNNINGKIYIGRTTKSLSKRWYYHLWKAKNEPNSKIYFYRALRKYGEVNLKKRTLCFVNSLEELYELEKFVISGYVLLHGKTNIYNTVYGGDGCESKLKGKTYEDIHGEIRGKELREIRSASLKGKPKSPEQVRKSAASRKGLKASDETKKILSEQRIGNKNHFFNKRHTVESKLLISQNHADVSGDKNPMKGRSVFSVWEEKYGREEAIKREREQVEKCRITKSNNKTAEHSAVLAQVFDTVL